jgi:hypothetical protein
MNASLRRTLLVGLYCSTLGAAAAIAAPLLVLDHGANSGPDHEALMRCLVAVRDEIGPGHGLQFSSRVATQRSPRGEELIVVRGSLWEGDARVAIEGRCGKDATNHVVARVIRIQNEAAFFAATR